MATKMTLIERAIAYVGERFIRWATGEGAPQIRRGRPYVPPPSPKGPSDTAS